MKRFLSVLLALAMVLSLAACGQQDVVVGVEQAEREAMDVSVYVLSGPTGIGAMNLWEQSDAGETFDRYHFTMPGSNDEVVAAISNGTADIACVATNLAATLYNKTNAGVICLAVNTLGVLHLLVNGETMDSIADLAGRTIYLPGQGANPEYILRYVLSENGLDPDSDVTLSFVGEGSELMTVWQSEPDAVILAPQPVATSLLMQYDSAAEAFDMTEEWDKVSGGDSKLMMGCVIARKDFCAQYPETVADFMDAYAASIELAQTDVSGTAALCEKYGLIPKAALAEKAIPACGVTYVDGDEMRAQLAGYLQVMFDADPKSVGGKLPGDDFYYVK